MPRSISILLILCHLQLVVATAVASPQQKQYDMTITVTKQNTLIADEGSKHGIIIDSIYDIRQNGVSIGRAVVRVVRETMCGLKLTEMNPGNVPKIGDKLILVNTLTVEENDILTEMQQTEFSRDKLVTPTKETSDYYYDGQAAADNDYGSAFGGGFLAGLLGGVIGWGIGYAIVNGQGADVPPRYLTDLNSDYRLQFSSGYKEKIKSKRKGTFNAGAGIGVLTLVVLIIAANSSQ